MKKLVVLLLMSALGWGIGWFFNPKRVIPKEKRISSSNWISRYDLYDYEEAVLKNGDKNKLSEIIGEADVERLPYIITAYDVYNKDVCIYLIQIYMLYKDDARKKNIPAALIPMKVFVDSVISEYEANGTKSDDMALIEYYKEQLKEYENEE